MTERRCRAKKRIVNNELNCTASASADIEKNWLGSCVPLPPAREQYPVFRGIRGIRVVKNKQTTLASFRRRLHDGMSIMVGGFMGVGTPMELIAAVLDAGVKNLTLIAGDTGFPDRGAGPLIVHRRVRKVIASHIGGNPETGRQMAAGELEVEFSPQGTLVERIRSGGAGLGGVLTPTGLGTAVEEGKKCVRVDGRDYLLELPLRADLALLGACRGDKAGNLQYRLLARNLNPVMALAADTVFAEVDALVDVGRIDPDLVMTPAALVDGVVLKNFERE